MTTEEKEKENLEKEVEKSLKQNKDVYDMLHDL